MKINVDKILEKIRSGRGFRGVFLLLFFGVIFSSCLGTGRKSCRLQIEWENLFSEALYVSYTDIEKNAKTDTIKPEGTKGKAKLQLNVPDIGESRVVLSSKEGSIYIPFSATARKHLKIKLDPAVPWVYTIEGVENEKLRRGLIRKISRSFDKLQASLSRKDSLKASELQEDLQRTIARYIDENATEPGIDLLSREFFPGWQGAKRFQLLTKKDTVARSLKYLHSWYNYYRTAYEEQKLVGLSSALQDTLNAIQARPGVTSQRIYLLEVLNEGDPSQNQEFDRSILSKVLADSVCRRLHVLYLPRTEKAIPELPPHPAIQDSLQADTEEKRLQAEARSLRLKRDSLVRQEQQKPNSRRNLYKELAVEADSLDTKAKSWHLKAKQAASELSAWREAPRRIVLTPFEVGWHRFRDLNFVEKTPYYFVFDRRRQLLYRGDSPDSALFMVDSLLSATQCPPREAQ